jgi:hypothetical protein
VGTREQEGTTEVSGLVGLSGLEQREEGGVAGQGS